MGIGILIADDEELVRTGFRMILEAEDDFEVLGEASSGAEAVKMARSLQPEVILMDIRMPDMDGLEAAAHLDKMENPPAVIFCTASRHSSTMGMAVAAKIGSAP